MSEMVGSVAGPAAMGGPHGRPQNGTTRGPPGPVPANPQAPSGVRTPTDIMRQRREREGRRKAEQEARIREQEEAERRRQQPEQQPPVQAQQSYAAGVDRTSQRRSTGTGGPRPGARVPRTGSMAGQPGPPPSSAQPVPASQPQQGHHVQFTGVPGKQPSAPPSQQEEQQTPRRVAFPHAFERWETLSSHWEGLTGYWIRKLEQNNQDLERDPLSQQMARQVTDLSAAGANLFHAVVELQRLRASSERKFQRWFFDTRAEQERTKEFQADLERQVQGERQARTEAVAAFQRIEGDRSRSQDLVKEMRRELQISKDEARRAWEELGRREQEERDRTASLRNGEPTLVGGVQVVPMVTGLPNRQPTNNPSTQEDNTYSRGGGYGKIADPAEGQYYEDNPSSPTGSDPFTEGRRKADTEPGPQGTYPGHFYNPQSSVVHHGRPASDTDDRSFNESSEPGDDDYDSYHRDSQGRPIVYPGTMSEGSDDYDPSMEDSGLTEGEYIPSTVPASSAPLYANYPPTSGEHGTPGWGWDSMTPRHRHPTRLSDVIEEEEPRTTPSRASRTSRTS